MSRAEGDRDNPTSDQRPSVTAVPSDPVLRLCRETQEAADDIIPSDRAQAQKKKGTLSGRRAPSRTERWVFPAFEPRI